MIEAMLKRYGVLALSHFFPSEIILDADAITERAMQNMGFGENKKGTNLDFSFLVMQEEQPEGN
tara:strand:+ start:207 stop:398 length:192 start_codon:yes stop_codon:yes gene_type:complete